jgi:Alcohol dehydrogenase GroES-like domain
MGGVVAIRKRKGQLMALVRGWGRWYPVESVTIEGWFVLPSQYIQDKKHPRERKEREMKAIGIVSENIGGPELLEVVEVAKPVPAAEEVLLQVKAAALTRDELTWPETWYIHGDSAQPRPRPIIPGHEVSGIVEAVGA